MNEVMIDGIRYVPESRNITEKSIRDVLKSQGYLSSSAIDNIIKDLRPSRNVAPRTIPKKTSKTQYKKDRNFEYGVADKNLFKIGGFLSNGSILYKSRRNPAKWNIQQAILIRKAMKNDSVKGLTYKDVLEIEEKSTLSSHMVRKIMYNIEYGDLVDFIKKWEEKNLQSRINVKPIQNNPQKRRDEFETYK